MSSHLPLLAAVLLAAPLAAQTVSLEFSPNPAPPGVPVTLTGTDSSGLGVQLPSPCTWVRIRQGSQAGPIVGPNLFCPAVIVPVAPNGTFSLVWDQLDASGVPVRPGVYWFETRVWDNGFTAIHTDWFCLSVQLASAPALTAAGPAQIGQSTPLLVSGPNAPGGSYFVAASPDSRNPVGALGLQTCLSDPIVFGLCTNPWGLLDANGNSTGVLLNIPNASFARYWGVQVQALVIDNLGGLALTNPLSFTLQ